MKSLYGKNLTKYVYLWGSSPQGKFFLAKKQRSVLYYYKNQEPSESKGMHNLPNSGTLGTFLRSSYSVLCRYCLEHVRIVWFTDDFRHHQLRLSLSECLANSKPWMDKLNVLQKLASEQGSLARILKVVADPPTTSLHHLKVHFFSLLHNH